MKKAVIFGGGNIGRGFIGQLFSESGYEVTFFDVDAALIEAMNRDRRYNLEIVGNDGKKVLSIGPVKAINSNDTEAVANAIAEADIGATAVGANVLKYIVKNMAAGLKLRAERKAGPINFIICENLHGAAAHVRELVNGVIAPEAKAYLDSQVGFVNTVIGRMVPVPTPEMRAQDVSLVRVEAYKELPVDAKGFVGPVPTITAMTAYDNFEIFTARKLYVHNCGHALMSYTGYQRGYTYGYEAMADPEIRDFMLAGLRESTAGICALCHADQAWLNAHVDDLLERFTNKQLGDKILRLGRDPKRKLAAEDRLTGAAVLAQKAGVKPVHLAWGMACALLFNPADDPTAPEIQQSIAENGVEKTICGLTGLSADDPIIKLVVEDYAILKQNPKALP